MIFFVELLPKQAGTGAFRFRRFFVPLLAAQVRSSRNLAGTFWPYCFASPPPHPTCSIVFTSNFLSSPAPCATWPIIFWHDLFASPPPHPTFRAKSSKYPRQPKQPRQPARCDLKLSVALIISMPHKQPKQSRQPKQPERGDKKTISRTDSFYATQGAQSPVRNPI